MTVVDLSGRLAEMERELAERPKPPKLYMRKSANDFVPGIELIVFVNTLDQSDRWVAAQSACLTCGLSKNWLGVAFSRPSTLEKLKVLGFSGEKHLINVLVKNSATEFYKPCLALDRADFDSLIEYAVNIGKPKAIALWDAFTLLGLSRVAGIADEPEAVQRQFAYFYEKRLQEIEEAGGGKKYVR